MVGAAADDSVDDAPGIEDLRLSGELSRRKGGESARCSIDAHRRGDERPIGSGRKPAGHRVDEGVRGVRKVEHIGRDERVSLRSRRKPAVGIENKVHRPRERTISADAAAGKPRTAAAIDMISKLVFPGAAIPLANLIVMKTPVLQFAPGPESLSAPM
jgi:hypothetical protein